MRVLLLGYYGRRNFGDDLLALVSVNLLRAFLPEAKLTIMTADPEATYLPTLLGDIQVVQPGHRGVYDLIVHGGGGTFFDYQEQGIGQRFMNALVSVLGPGRYVRLENLVRRVLGKQRVSGKHRIGLGVGIGTYVAGSPGWRHDIHSLTEFEQLIVRDVLSLGNLSHLPIACKPELGSDLVFLREFWPCPELRHSNGHSDTKKIGVVLRHWSGPQNGQYLDYWKRQLQLLSALAEVTLFVFDDAADAGLNTQFSDYPIVVWQPGTTTIADYCESLAAQDAIVTARAHGAIVANLLGRPAAIINLEPKLETIHDMLPESTLLVDPMNVDADRLLEQLFAIPDQVIITEGNSNRATMLDVVSPILSGFGARAAHVT